MGQLPNRGRMSTKGTFHHQIVIITLISLVLEIAHKNDSFLHHSQTARTRVRTNSTNDKQTKLQLL